MSAALQSALEGFCCSVLFLLTLKLWPFCEMTDLECKYGKFFSVIWEDVKYYEGKISIGESRS